jgi:hypothetical protein
MLCHPSTPNIFYDQVAEKHFHDVYIFIHRFVWKTVEREGGVGLEKMRVDGKLENFLSQKAFPAVSLCELLTFLQPPKLPPTRVGKTPFIA